MSAAQAPTATAGTGKLVTGPAVKQPTLKTQKTAKRSTLLSQLSVHEREAFLQEQLDQGYLFRQMCALSHGLPAPGGPNILSAVTSDEEITEEAQRTGMSEEEVRRREELAAREAITKMREDLLKNQAENTTGTNTDMYKLLGLTKFWTPLKGAVAGISGAGVLGAAAWAAAYLWPDDKSVPPVDTPVVTQPVDKDEKTDTVPVNTDTQTLLLLQAKGLAAPRTPLGEKVQEAFEKNPALREQLMRQIEETLLQKND